MLGGGEILRIGITVDASAQGGEYFSFWFLFNHRPLPR